MSAILHSSLETDLRLADLIAGEVQILLAATFSIRDVPGALLNLGSINGRGSDTIRVPQMQIDALSATAAENTSVANTALTDSSFTCAVVRHALVRELSDLANMTARLRRCGHRGPGSHDGRRHESSVHGLACGDHGDALQLGRFDWRQPVG